MKEETEAGVLVEPWIFSARYVRDRDAQRGEASRSGPV